MLNDFLQATRAPERRNRQPLRPANRPPKRPYRISADLLFLADPNTLHSAAASPHPKRRKHIRDERNVHAVPPTPSPRIEEDASDLIRLQRLHHTEANTNDLRIFEDQEEITPRFRNPTLPSNFLNSEHTGNTRKRPLNASIQPNPPHAHRLQQERSRKRFKPQIANQNLRRPREDEREHSPQKRVDSIPDSHRRSFTRAFRFRHDTGPPCSESSAFDRIPLLSPSLRQIETRIHRLDDEQVPDLPGSSEVYPLRSTSNGLTGLEERVTQQGCIARPLQNIHTEPLMLADEPSEPRSRNRHKQGSFRGCSAERLSRRNTSPLQASTSSKDWYRESSHPLEENSQRMPLAEKFPHIEIDSERGSPSSRENTILQPRDSFQNILSRDPFYLNVLSAEVIQIENELLDQPDGDVRTFSMRQRRRDRGTNKQNDEPTHRQLQSVRSKEAVPLDENEMKENKSLASNPIRQTQSNPAPDSQNVQRPRDIDQQEVTVEVLLNAKNPVTDAITPVWSESTERPRGNLR